MKVLFIYLGKRGGGEIYALSVAKRLLPLVDMKVMISKYAENIERWREDIGNLYEIDTYTTGVEFAKNTLTRKALREIKAIIYEEKPDIIYYPMLSPWAPMISAYANYGKVVSTIHDYKPHLGDGNPLNTYLQSKAIKRSDGLIFLSGYTREQWASRCGNKSSVVIPLGAFDFYFEDEEDRYNPIDGRANVLFMGRILKYKGLDILLKAYPQIRSNVTNCKLIIAGQGNITPYRKDLISCLDIEIHNYFLSNEEIAEFVRMSDILVLPYIEASQSGVLTIGLDYGLPVIASRIGGIQEQVENGITGVLVEPKNSDQLAEECIRLLQDSSLRKFLSRNEIKFAGDSLGWAKITQRIVSFFEEVLTTTARN